jgi:formate dehydrogenase subunit gamma
VPTQGEASWSTEAALEVLATTRDEPGPVLISLQALQKVFGYVPHEAIALVAEACNVSRADVHGVLTFYHDLRTSPVPRNRVYLCAAEACQAVGSRELAKALKENGAVEIKDAYCFGNCALGPSAMVNGTLIGRATAETLLSAIESGATA